jgi:UDP-N-acetylmuramoyl-tripeptide--D-alanyl-D-alanine ligase
MTPFDAFLECGMVTTDTRNIIPGSVFFALKGTNFNGNDFALEALTQGARYAVVDETMDQDIRIIHVSDVLEALQSCAKSWRNHLNIPVFGLTGSNGKTTNKELMHAVLSTKYKTHATFGNLNNHVGVPLTILSMSKETEVAIIEMGANHQGEIALLAGISQPTIGYITNYGKAHMEGFGGLEGIIKGKSELYDFAFEHQTQVMVNFDDSLQSEKTKDHNRFGFGHSKGGVTWKSTSDNEFASIQLETKGNSTSIKSQLSGHFNESNLAAAAALGLHFDVPLKDIKTALETYVPSMNRVEWRKTEYNAVLMDAYNANPTSMSLSIQNFGKWHTAGLMILGDMYELGKASKVEHEAIVREVISLDMAENCILIGEHFYDCNFKGLKFKTTKHLIDFWQKKGAPRDASILLKGSRGIALERLLPHL